jgi:hypothetical protein
MNATSDGRGGLGMNAGPMDTITLARPADGGAALAKTIVVCGTTITAMQPAKHVAAYRFEAHAIQDLESLTAVLERGASTNAIAVRGKPKAPTGRRAIYDDAEKGPAGLEVVPRCWVAFDWDGLPLEPQSEPQPPEVAEDEAEFCNWSLPDLLLDPEVGARGALRRLPPAFRDCSLVWQVSASAGFKPGFRLRTWHWLDHPTSGHELKVWLAPAITRGMVDPVTTVECQPHFLAVRVLAGEDPCPRRFSLLRLAHEAVRVPDIAGIAMRRRERELAARPAPAPAAPRPARTPGERLTDVEAEARLEQCYATIKRSANGARHPTYKAECARAKGLCDEYGLDWATARHELIRAYESMLRPDEARQRRDFSTLGVLEWLEKRSAA